MESETEQTGEQTAGEGAGGEPAAESGNGKAAKAAGGKANGKAAAKADAATETEAAKAPKTGKAAKDTPEPAGAGAARDTTEADLLDAYTAAEKKVADAKAAVTAAELARDDAGKALGAMLIPPGARKNERFQFWVGLLGERKCMEIVVGREGKFTIQPYTGNRPAA